MLANSKSRPAAKDLAVVCPSTDLTGVERSRKRQLR